MKGQHRKELETNILADKMGKLFTGAKTGGGLLLALLIVGGLLLIAFYFLPENFRGRLTVAWFDFYNSAQSGHDLEEASRRHRGSPIVAPARLLQADHLYERAMGVLRTPEVAKQHLEKAIEFYRPLARDPSHGPLLQARAALGWAQSEEALYWLATDSSPSPDRLAAVIQRYREVRNLGSPDLHAKNELHPILAQAEARLRALESPEVASLVLSPLPLPIAPVQPPMGKPLTPEKVEVPPIEVKPRETNPAATPPQTVPSSTKPSATTAPPATAPATKPAETSPDATTPASSPGP